VPPTVADRLRHIHQAIVEIESLLANKSRQEFADDRLLRLAIERLLEIASEASRHIPEETRQRASDIPWRRVADLGNRLRHAYHQVDPDLLWNILGGDLSALKGAVDRLMNEAE
jgi:uncharacterized protein with HEPN domain